MMIPPFLDTLVPEGPSCVFYGYKVLSLLTSDSRGILLVLWFDNTDTEKHTGQTGANGLTHSHINTSCYVVTATICITLNEKFADIKHLRYRVPQYLYLSKITCTINISVN